MIVLIWATLLLSVRGSSAETAEKQHCDSNGYCVTLTEGELTAEAGLCVVIPCSFTTAYSFTPQSIVWYKCEPSYKKCGDSNMIFHPNKNNQNIQSGFRRRVSLLEPDVRQNNCSIIINDLSDSDSGSYHLRVNGDLHGRPDGYTFLPQATVSVKGLTQKPSVMIPPLTEGKQATLTCTAPGLCSGSQPKISWTWRGAGGNDPYIKGNITAVKTESLTAVTKRHSSSLTITPSSEHHGTKITCKVSFKGGPTTEETLTLNVNYVKEVEITGNRNLKKGETLNLTCSVESFPPCFVVWTKRNRIGSLIKNRRSSTLVIPDVTPEHSGQYICEAVFMERPLFSYVNITVSCLTQKPSVMIPPLTEGKQATLTCTAPGLCSGSQPKISWTWRGAGGNDPYIKGNITAVKTESLTAVTKRHSSSLTITPSAEHHGTKITCKVSFKGGPTTEETLTLNVNYVKEVEITGNRNLKKGETLNLTCSVESFPPCFVVWTKRNRIGSLIKNRRSSTLVIPDVTPEHSGQYICEAVFMERPLFSYVNITVSSDLVINCGSCCPVLQWVVAGVSLSVNVLVIILISRLWNSRKTVKPNQDDRTYMSLLKTDASPEYEITAQRRN